MSVKIIKVRLLKQKTNFIFVQILNCLLEKKKKLLLRFVKRFLVGVPNEAIHFFNDIKWLK